MPEGILIVEDEFLLALYLKTLLEGRGFSVSGIAHNEREVFAQFGKFRPSFVIMDINLEAERDGIQIAGDLSRIGDFGLIFVSGNSDTRTRERAAGLRPLAYLVKPIQIEALTQALVGG